MAKAAILGYGTVGSGVFNIIKTNSSKVQSKAAEEVAVKYVLDLRTFPNDPVEEVLTHDFNDILNDDEVSVVVEVMGGLNPAYDFVKSSLLKGKHVCTSNKELVAAHGAELIKIAEEKNVNFFFEASVGGGIPIIRPMITSITADEILEIKGILNGTTNYMLTKMAKDDSEYDEVLKRAQELGYAERNPAADVEGYDACRKIAILMSLVLEQQVNYTDIQTEGITNISKADISYAKAMGKAIKLLGYGKTGSSGSWAMVAPFIVGEESPLFMVNGVFNGICITGNMLGDIMFYGKGAGKDATASAVVSDVINIVNNKNRHICINWNETPAVLNSTDSLEISKLVRIETFDENAGKAAVSSVFGNVEFVKAEGTEDEIGFITPVLTEAETDRRLSMLLNKDGIENILNTIRIN